MKWNDLLPPLRRAVHDLLARIAGAEVARRSGPRQSHDLGNCFLVYGACGTGKTTVLLSARHAAQHPEPGGAFFAASDPADAIERGARAHAEALKKDQHIVWLDPLDLEPLQPSANLLTTLLTRVRGALDAAGEHREAARATSIFEDSAGDARQQLGELINDATLMWEEIHEPDTRNKALRQRAAADIYAGFGERYQRAMDALSKKLDLRHGGDQGCAIVLPIDNIDRSPEHLKAIVKLAQMVAHPCLWLVMAGDRVEVTSFLERAYWRELIEGPVGTDARGKAGEAGEDESEGMARRQAHAMAQKVWPPSHRIEVDALQPDETLDFKPAGEPDTIRALLEDVKVPCFIEGKGQQHQTIDLIDLFELPEACAGDHDPPDRLTPAARAGLCLPVRAALDLWQLAHRVAADQPPRQAEAGQRADRAAADRMSRGAVKIPRTMVRAAAAGSNLPNQLVQKLQESIQRDAKGGTLINFEDLDFRANGLLSVSARITEPVEAAPANGPALCSRLSIGDTRDMLVHYACGNRPLPELVGVWLAVLHDVLYWVPELAVLGRPRIEAPIVWADHEAVALVDGMRWPREARFTWPAPPFSTFDAHGNFWRHWAGFRADDEARCGAGGSCPGHPCPTLQLRGWLRCVLRTVEESGPPRGRAATRVDHGKSLGSVLDDAASLYDEIRSEGQRPLRERHCFEGAAVRGWLEWHLPLLLTPLYTPGGSACPHRPVDWVKAHRSTRLVEHWRRNREFLWADLDERLDRMFVRPGDPASAAGAGTPLPLPLPLPQAQREVLQRWAYGDLADALG